MGAQLGGDNTGRALPRREFLDPGGTAVQRGTALAEGERLGMPLRRNLGGLVRSTFIEQRVPTSAAGAGQGR